MVELSDLKWQAIEARIYEIAEEQYRLGFLDGEASVRPMVVDGEPQEIGGVCV